MKRFRVGRISGPPNRSNESLWLLLQLLNERSEAFCLIGINLLAQEGCWNKGRVEVGMDERAHPRRQNPRGEKIMVHPAPPHNAPTLVCNGAVRSDNADGPRLTVRTLSFLHDGL